MEYPQAIDLGLPSGTMWANCNLGARTPLDMGLKVHLYEERVPKEPERSPKYNWNDVENDPMARGALENYIYEFFYPKPVKYRLSFFMNYDVVEIKWGDAWQLPTGEQTDELFRCCKRRYGSIEGWKKGIELTGPNGNRIFLPVRFDPSAYWWGKSGEKRVDKYVNIEKFTTNIKTSFLPMINTCIPYIDSVWIRPVAKQ